MKTQQSKKATVQASLIDYVFLGVAIGIPVGRFFTENGGLNTVVIVLLVLAASRLLYKLM